MKNHVPSPSTRRDFIKKSAAVSATVAFPSIGLGQAAAKRKLKLGFIGTGGRGTGAASQALLADENVELHAIGDVFQSQIDKALGVLNAKQSGQVNAPAERQFVGLDAYEKVLDSGVDVYNENSDYITGETGVLTIGKGADPFITDQKGGPKWRFRSKPDSGMDPNMYQQEHNELFASIRGEKAHNDGEWMTHSCLLGIMGRMAAFTGQKITWDQVLADETSLYPEGLDWDSRIEVGPMPAPGGFSELVPVQARA